MHQGLSGSAAGTQRLLRDRAVQVQELHEGLGRASLVRGALDYDRPFLPVMRSQQNTRKTASNNFRSVCSSRWNTYERRSDRDFSASAESPEERSHPGGHSGPLSNSQQSAHPGLSSKTDKPAV